MKRWLSRRLNELLQYQRKYRIRRLIRKGMISVGDYTYGVYNLNVKEFRGNAVDLEIGKFCSIAENVTVITGGIHPVEWVSTFPLSERFLSKKERYFTREMPSSHGKITIGNDVWIASSVTILSGVTIGDGAIIAAGVHRCQGCAPVCPVWRDSCQGDPVPVRSGTDRCLIENTVVGLESGTDSDEHSVFVLG